MLVFGYKFPTWVSLSVTAMVLLPALFKAFLGTQSWPTRPVLACFLLSALPGLYATAFPQVTVEKLIIFALAASVYLAVVCVRRDLQNLQRWTGLFIAGVFTLSMAGPFLTDFAAKNKVFKLPWSTLSRFRFHEVLDANLLAALVAMTLPIVLGLCLCHACLTRGRWSRVGAWFVFAGLLAALLITESRAGYLSGLAALLLIPLMFYPRLRALYAAGGAIAFALSFVTGVRPVLDQLLTVGAVTTAESRKEVWIRAVYMMQDFPFTGIGAGTFSKVAPSLYPFFVLGPDAEIFHAHNLFLQVAVDLGIPGLVAFTGLLAACLLLGIKAYRSFRLHSNAQGMTLCIGYLCGLLAMVVHGMLDAPLWLTKPHAVPFFYMGMLVALYGAAHHAAEAPSEKR